MMEEDFKALEMRGDELVLLDQRLLPTVVEDFVCHTVEDVYFAIRDMVVRGAPAIGGAAGYGVLFAAREAKGDIEAFRRSCAHLVAARPTAVNLSWAVRRVAKVAEESGLDAYVLCLAPQAKTAALQLVTQLRSSGYRCDMDYLGRSFKAQFKSVERKHSRTAIFLGDKELESGEVTIKEIDTQKQHIVPLNDIVAVMDRLFDETQETEGGCTCGHVHE